MNNRVIDTKKLDYKEPQKFKSDIYNFKTRNSKKITKIQNELNKEFTVAFLHSTTGFLKEHEAGA